MIPVYFLMMTARYMLRTVMVIFPLPNLIQILLLKTVMFLYLPGISMRFNLSIFTGNKFCLFNFATRELDGFVDFDWFRIDWSSITVVGPEENLNSYDIPQNFFLEQNYPNPFNPNTMINYQLAMECNVQLKVYDMLGREVALLVDENQQAGRHSVHLTDFNAHQQSGVYFYKLEAGSFIQSRKMILIK